MDIRMLALVLLVNVVGSLADLRSPLFRLRRNGLREDRAIATDGISRTGKRESSASNARTTALPVSTLHLYTLIPPDPTTENTNPWSAAPSGDKSNTPKNVARRATNEPDSTTESESPSPRSPLTTKPPKSPTTTGPPDSREDPYADSKPKRPAPKPAGRSTTPKPKPRPRPKPTSPEEGAEQPDPEISEKPKADPEEPDREASEKANVAEPEQSNSGGGKRRADTEDLDPESETRGGKPRPRAKAKPASSEEELSARQLPNAERPKPKAWPANSEEEEEREPEEGGRRQPLNDSKRPKRPKGKPTASSEEADPASKPRGKAAGSKPAIGARLGSPDDEEEPKREQVGIEGRPGSKSNRIPNNPQNPNFQFPFPFFMPSFVPGFSSPYSDTYNPNSNAWAGTNAGTRGYGSGGAASFASASASAGGASDIPTNYNGYPRGYPGGYGDTSNTVNAPTPGVYNSGGYGSYGGGVYDPSSFAFPDYNFADFQKQMEENFRQLQAQFQKQQQSIFDATNRIAGDPNSVPLHSAVSSINLGPEGGYQAGAINPVGPGVESRFGEEVPPPSGNSYGVFSSSSSHTMVGPDGKTISHKSSTTGVNDNGKITFRTIED